MSIIRAGRLLSRPFTDFASYYTRVAKAKPLVTAFVTSGLKTSAADMFAQKVTVLPYPPSMAAPGCWKESIECEEHFIFVFNLAQFL